MDIARFSIDRPIITWLLILTFLFGGIGGFLSLGRLEDPAFTIKVSAIITEYPGASAEELAREVSEPLESAIQKMDEVGQITSRNTPGLSVIEVEIVDTIDGTELPDIWTKLRARVSDAALFLPQGASQPYVNDSFGDVFGMYYAVTTEGFSDQEKHTFARYLRREVLAVEGVADVELSGLPEEAIFVEPNLAVVANQNIPVEAFLGALETSNSLADAGTLDNTRLSIANGTNSVSDIANLSVGVDGLVLNIVDIASVSRERVEDPEILIRHNGAETFTIGIAGLATENIVEVGERVEQRLAEIMATLPLGVDLHPIYEQHKIVNEASNNFLINLAMSVAIVVVVLAVFMGPRAALTVGTTLFLTVLGTLLFMLLFSIEMERISLGALIIAMGMLVDNAIVVAEGMQTAMARGKSSREAATEAASKTQVPLLGATVIGVLAFAPIGLSPDSTGEFMFSLFAVIGISLLLSWFLALTVTPLIGHYTFVQGQADGQDAYSGLIFRGYAWLLKGALRFRWLVSVALVAITAACLASFGQVKEQFFPDSNTPLFFVDYKLPQGATIHETEADIAVLETWLDAQEKVTAYTTYAGDGALRFMLTYPTAKANSSFGHLIVRANDVLEIPDIMAEMRVFAAENLPQGELVAKQLAFGPGEGDPIQLRISGPDASVLRSLAIEAERKMRAATDSFAVLRTDWREQELVIHPVYATERAKAVGISRDDIAETMRFATDGVPAGVYREDERQIPIIIRAPRDTEMGLTDHLVYSNSVQRLIPMQQVIEGLSVIPQDTIYHRRDRVPTLTLSGAIAPDVSAAEVLAEIRADIEAIDLPPGYALAWGGEYEDTLEANVSLAQQLPLAVILMVVISIVLFNALRQPLIIWLMVPMAANGVVIGLLATDLPFSFTALLGMLSLSGMLIKNGIVLVEEIDLVRTEQHHLDDAIVTASSSRLRPVMLAAATTILGMLPLLSDAFFVSMAVTIMAGLAFATVLTLIAAPVFYRILFNADPPKQSDDDVHLMTLSSVAG
ncbi:efflux RND transporter permease subunit [Tateyamaria omphalii]|uniref:efflux RND transporter permease subunit n=1 Tax=Tateyamaria omphalii TaxID=299262 RepID=UPI001C9A0B65|nr:efflux RND transporter permease subunit [Tateyamaria omphalii]MBY5934942.1 efflux RND transporter permease subunit [Tateyamaria omphalii]